VALDPLQPATTHLILAVDARYASASRLARRGYDVIFTIVVLLGFVGIAGFTAATLTLVFGA
jgi:hypothetical protein